MLIDSPLWNVIHVEEIEVKDLKSRFILTKKLIIVNALLFTIHHILM